MPKERWSLRKWWVLILIAISGTAGATLPVSGLPVLFKEIAEDLGLNVVDVGSVWGTANLAGLFVCIIAGLMADRFGGRRVMIISLILIGLTGALRGLSDSFLTLGLTVFLNGVVRYFVPITMVQIIGRWFKGSRLGLAMGIMSLGAGLGLALGPLISATIMSPWLGSWRNVMFFYGGLSAFVGLLWLFLGRRPDDASPEDPPAPIPVWNAIKELIKLKVVWKTGLVMACRSGAMIGLVGYIAWYLRDHGWVPAAADASLSSFNLISAACVIPIVYLSNRLRSRKTILIVAFIMSIVCIPLLPHASVAGVWVCLLLTGMTMDGFLSVIVTLFMESEEVRPAYAGIAFGMVVTLQQVGSVLAPPIGNSLELVHPGMPFYFWGAMSLAGLLILVLWKTKRTQMTV